MAIMKQFLVFLFALVAVVGMRNVQAQSGNQDKDTWYVWVDVTVTSNGEDVRLVSAAPMVITCCVKSAKYRRFVQKTAKWITRNIAPEFNGELTLTKLQDRELATEMLAKAQAADNVQLIDYRASCK